MALSIPKKPSPEFQRRLRGLRRNRRCLGFTLVEMLVVLAIIGLVVGLVGPRVVNYLSESKVKAAQIQMENIASALELYYLDNSRYPVTSEGLQALVQRPADSTNWNGPYVKSAAALKDPWGKAYYYRSPGETAPFDLGSFGPDGREGARPSIARLGDAAAR